MLTEVSGARRAATGWRRGSGVSGMREERSRSAELCGGGGGGRAVDCGIEEIWRALSTTRGEKVQTGSLGGRWLNARGILVRGVGVSAQDAER